MSLYIDIHTHGVTQVPEDVLALSSVLIKGVPAADSVGFYSAGIHPWDAFRAQESWLDIFDLQDRNLIAIGEIGLDYRKEYEPYDVQLKWFVKQVRMAENIGIPIVIHNVRAQGEILKVLKNRDLSWIIHGFTGSIESAMMFVNAGGYISFGEGLFHSDRTAEALRMAPPECIFLETDESKMPITAIYSKAAKITGIREEKLRDHIEKNFRKVFTRATV